MNSSSFIAYRLRQTERFLFFLVILFLPTQLGKHFWPEFAYIYSLKIDYLSPTIYFWDLLVLGLFIIWILQKPKLNLTAVLIFQIFLLSQILSFFKAINLGAGLVRVEQLIICGLFFIYISSKSLSDLKANLRNGLMGALFMQAFLAIGQFLKAGTLGFWILGERSFSLSTPSIATFNFQGEVFLRPYGTFPHPNVLGAFMILVLPLMVYLKTKKGDLWALFSIATSSLVAVISFSRAVILVLIAEGFLFFKGKVILIILVILLPILLVRFGSLINFDNLSLIRRSELIEISLVQFLSSPILGVGLNNFINNVSVSELVSGPSRFLQPVHNVFLLSLAETGILGLLGFLGLLGYPLFKLWRMSDQFSKTTLGLLLITCFLGLFDHYFLTLPQGQRMMFLVLGLALIK